jgi:asparagine synthase (glutamine-hydrolysing)
MCGICGYVGADLPQAVLQAMCASLRHRGPDDDGAYVEPGRVALGMRRLSIIDVAGGRQPIFNEDRRVVTVYNGEIYNFAALRTALEARGHRFTTRTDTEVIVHGYEEYGPDIFEKLDGMFGIAVWDSAAGRLVLARDRLGIKPVYYAWSQGRLIFASEIKAILQVPGLVPRLDLAALDGYLTYQYVPAPLTLFSGIYKLPPGHWVSAAPGGSEPAPQPFWKFDFSPRQETGPAADWIEALEAALQSAVRSHLVSEVPLGAFLSGGVDSSTLVALMSRAMAQPVKTFSVGFEARTAKNELEQARAVARHLGTDHHELVVTPDMAHQLPQLVWHMDEPLGDPAALPTFFVSQLARRCGVTVALSGEGADEMFAGYPKYWQDRYLGLYTRLPVRLRRLALSMADRLPRPERERRLLARLARVQSEDERVLAWRKVGFPDPYRARLLAPEVQRAVSGRVDRWVARHLESDYGLSPLQKMLRLDTLSWLPDDLLMKVDRMSMASSLEVRVPYLDNQVVALAGRMPEGVKLAGRRTKHALKSVARRLLPSAIVDRPKQGFELPLDEWLRGALGRHFRELTLGRTLDQTGLFNRPYLEALWSTHQAGEAGHGARLWMLANLSVWLDTFQVQC